MPIFVKYSFFKCIYLHAVFGGVL